MRCGTAPRGTYRGPSRCLSGVCVCVYVCTTSSGNMLFYEGALVINETPWDLVCEMPHLIQNPYSMYAYGLAITPTPCFASRLTALPTITPYPPSQSSNPPRPPCPRDRIVSTNASR